MYSRKRISHSKQGEPFLFAHTAHPRPEIMPPKERLTVTEHLPKYGADAAFYTNTEEGASIICKPLPYCRLRGDTGGGIDRGGGSGARKAMLVQPRGCAR